MERAAHRPARAENDADAGRTGRFAAFSSNYGFIPSKQYGKIVTDRILTELYKNIT